MDRSLLPNGENLAATRTRVAAFWTSEVWPAPVGP
jgi:bisphosphoglycerate-dependent phosphoglycerate mutase